MSEGTASTEQQAEPVTLTYFNLSMGGPLDLIKARMWLAYSDGSVDQKTFEGTFADVLENIAVVLFGEEAAAHV